MPKSMPMSEHRLAHGSGGPRCSLISPHACLASLASRRTPPACDTCGISRCTDNARSGSQLRGSSYPAAQPIEPRVALAERPRPGFARLGLCVVDDRRVQLDRVAVVGCTEQHHTVGVTLDPGPVSQNLVDQVGEFVLAGIAQPS